MMLPSTVVVTAGGSKPAGCTVIVTVGGGGGGLLLACTDAAAPGEAFGDEHDTASIAMRPTASSRAKRPFHPARFPGSS
jgi:hypothetical protein